MLDFTMPLQYMVRMGEMAALCMCMVTFRVAASPGEFLVFLPDVPLRWLPGTEFGTLNCGSVCSIVVAL